MCLVGEGEGSGNCEMVKFGMVSGTGLLSWFSCGNAADELGHKPTICDIHTRDDGIRQVHLRAGDVSAEQRGDY